MYTADNQNTDTYVMPGMEFNSRIPSPVFDNFEMMARDGTPEYAVDPSLYYPAATPYGYYCTGFESQPGEWDDPNAVYGLDGTDSQYVGAQSENVPYVYYSPTYGYGESLINPYNAYVPGSMVGADGSFVGTQPYYAVSPYSNPTSPGYYPVLVQSGTDIVASTSRDTMTDVVSSAINKGTGSAAKLMNSSSPATYSMKSVKAPSSQSHVIAGASQASKIGTGSSKRPINNRNGGPIGSVNGGSSHAPQGGNSSGSLQSTRNISYGKLLSQANQVKHSFSSGDCLPEYESSTGGQTILNDTWSKFYYRGLPNDSYSDELGEQNRGPRTNKSKNEFVVKAYTTRAGVRNAEGNIVISANQYNKNDTPIDYVNAKFFVIKSYSEDDVHKSIKYNVWSSTLNGNKKLSSAYEDSQKIGTGQPRGCPIFLFFSVNASGQFCGVAEMVGPVDFEKDMDFWQQDKWSGSFPVQWHIIKDVPNTTFRHIILENNEHKPVTNSRDTQEIMHKQGLEMLKLFKDYSSKTSLLDDFMYYENRQKIMYEERTRHLRRASGHAHPTEYPLKFTVDVDHSQKLEEVGTWVEKGTQVGNSSGVKVGTRSSEAASNGGDGHLVSDLASMAPSSSEVQIGDVSTLKIGSLSIHPKPSERQCQVPATTFSLGTAMPKSANVYAPGNVVTVGSMPIKVDGANKSSKMLTVGTIACDPKALKHGKVGGSGKGNM